MRAPTASVDALARRRLGQLTYVAWGGGLPLEMLLSHGVISRIEMCFSNFDVFGLAPRFRAAAESGAVELVDLTALGLISGLRAEAENLVWEVMHEPAGSDLMGDRSTLVDSGAGVPMVKVSRLRVDVMLLHAQRADDAGNVEISGARATDLATAFAAREVLVSVEERVPQGALGLPRSFILPRSHVSRLAVVPFGAYPTSCLPYYGADLRALGEVAKTPVEAGQPLRLPRASPARRRELEAAAKLTGAETSSAVRHARRRLLTEPWTVAELMTVLLARTVTNESICSFGSSAPLPAAAYLLAKATHAPEALLMSFNGGYVDIASRPMTLTLAEQHDFESAAVHAGGDETYRWYYQPGMVTHEVVGSAQVDSRGATNNLWITRRDGSRIRLPGQGGMADVANLHRDFIIYLPRQDPRNLVQALEVVSARRVWQHPELRRSYGLQPGRTAVMTNLGVLELSEDTGRLELVQLHPGVDVEQFHAASGFAVATTREVDETPPPAPEELGILRSLIDPLGICALDFVAARDRPAQIERILAAERSAVASLGVETDTDGLNGGPTP